MQERISLPDKEIVIVGTAHLSRESVDEVKHVIADETPDVVAVELDQHRYESMTDAERWKELDVKEALREGKGSLLLVNVLLSIYQRKLGETVNLDPGAEMLAAVEAAEAHSIPVELVDRDVQDTIRDLLRSLSVKEKLLLAASVLEGLVGGEEVDAEDIEALKERDMLEAMLDELGGRFPAATEVLLEKRDRTMAERVAGIDAGKVVLVVGAAHVQGVASQLRMDDHDPVETPPERRFSPFTAVKYGVPLLIIGMFAAILFGQGIGVAGEAFSVWFALNAVLAAVGAALARAHPFTVATAFVAAPFTSLNPALPAGLVAAYAEQRFDPPRVQDLEAIGQVSHYGAFWSNKALNLLLIFFLVNLGSAAATYLGGGYLASLLL